MDLFNQLRAFVATAFGSFTGAATQLGISNRLTSKYVAELEQHLGVRLFQRTTRKVGLTPAGSDLLSRAPALLDDLDDLLADVSDSSKGSHGLFDLSDGLVQGSSIMPQKRNPVALEHARTHFSRTLGSAQMVLFSSHNIPYADLNDFGPDIQGALVSQFIQLEGGLELLTACLQEGKFNVRKLEQEARCSDTTATELADELTRHYNVSFQEGHHLAAALVQKLCKEGKKLREASTQDLLDLGGPEVDERVLKDAIDPVKFVERRAGFGGPAPAVVKQHLAHKVQAQTEIVDKLAHLHSRLAESQQNLSETSGNA